MTVHVAVEPRYYPRCDQCGRIGMAAGFERPERAKVIAEEHRQQHREPDEGEEE